VDRDVPSDNANSWRRGISRSVPDSPDVQQRLAALEAAVASSASTQRLGLIVSVAFLGFTVYQWWTRPEPIVLVERLDDV
jgi:hypothetical protein